LRIIGGTHRGRKLPIPNLEGLRPTSDRIRETVFNWLQADLPGMNVLDLFAGTGALGLEALSREAKYAAFVEPQSMAASFISQSIATLRQDNARVFTQSAEHFLNTPGDSFDLVFVDPPFTLDLWERSLALLIEQNRLSKGAFVYLECPKHQAISIPDGFETVKDKTGGKVRFRLLRMV
jgi:16S rRNA (guanine966-N2)-methyltransferase